MDALPCVGDPLGDALSGDLRAHEAATSLAAEGFREPGTWAVASEWMQRRVLEEMRTNAGLTLAQLAHVERGLD